MAMQEIPDFLKTAFCFETYAPFVGLWAKAGLSVLEQLEQLQNQAADRIKQAIDYQTKATKERAELMVSIGVRVNQLMREQLSRLATA